MYWIELDTKDVTGIWLLAILLLAQLVKYQLLLFSYYKTYS